MSCILKRVAALCLTGILLVSGMTSAKTFPEDIAGTDFEQDAQFLLTLGILEPNNSNLFSPDVTITRGNMAQLAIRLMNLQVSGKEIQIYSDVPKEYYAADEIAMVNQLGIMSGRDDGRFYPEEFITYADALTVCLRVLGYRDLAEAMPGDYPYNYYQLAHEAGITQGISMSMSENVKRSVLTVLLRRTLELEVYQQVGWSENSVSHAVTKEETLLSLYHHIQRIKGQVTATDITYLANTSTLPENHVQIRNVMLKTGETEMRSLLGHTVQAYYDMETETILYYEDQTKKILTIPGEDIVSYSNSVLRYKNGEKEASLTILPGTYVIYNKKAVELFSASMLSNVSGNVKLLDGDNDGSYEVLLVENSTDYFVEKVNSTSKLISCKGGTTLKMEEASVDIAVYDETGSKVDYTDIVPHDILTVFVSENKDYKEIHISKTAVSGTLVSESEQDGKRFFILQSDETEKTYAANKTMKTLYPDLNVGSYGTFYFNMYENIVGYLPQDSDAMLVGYLIDGMMETGIEESARIKVFAHTGEMMICELAQKVELDGAKEEKEAVLPKLSNFSGDIVSQLIRFKLNTKGEVNWIDSTFDGAQEYSERLQKIYDTGAEAATHQTGPMIYVHNSVVVHAENDAVIFSIPTGDVKKGEADDFRIIPATEMVNGGKYAYSAYKVEEKQVGASYIVTSAPEVFAFARAETVSVISKISKVINNDGEIVHKVGYYYQGKFSEALTKDEDVMKNRSVGDAMRLHFNNKGEIDGFEHYFDGAAKMLVTDTNPSKTDVNAQVRVCYGSAYRVYNDLVILCTDDTRLPYITNYTEEASCESHRAPNKGMYLFDTAKNVVRVATWDEITDYLTDSSAYSKLFTFQNYSRDTDIMIVK